MATPGKINPCPNLRNRIMLELERGAFDRKYRFNLEAVMRIVAPLPVKTGERIMKQFAAFCRAYRNTKLYGKKCTNNSLSRLIARLDESLFNAETALHEKYDDWDEGDDEIQAESTLLTPAAVKS